MHHDCRLITFGSGPRVGTLLLVSVIACSPASSHGGAGAGPASKAVIRITGSDTMVNLLQAWAEHYTRVQPAVSVQIAGGGSGVGIAGLIEGTLDIAAASREIKPAERQRVKTRYASEPREFTFALDALAVYAHRQNPVAAISLDSLAEIYGEQGRIASWSQLGLSNPACPSDRIIRVGRQNNSGTFAYFRDVVLGSRREYKMGSIDQSGSKDVVALVSRTPCAIGYSGIAYATSGVKALSVSAHSGGQSIAPTENAVLDESYPLARPLYLYTATEPGGEVKTFLEWTLSPDGQRIVRELGLVPVPTPGSPWRPEGRR